MRTEVGGHEGGQGRVALEGASRLAFFDAVEQELTEATDEEIFLAAASDLGNRTPQ